MKKIIIGLSLCFSLSAFAQQMPGEGFQEYLTCLDTVGNAIFAYNNAEIQAAGKAASDAQASGDAVAAASAQARIGQLHAQVTAKTNAACSKVK